MDFCQQQVFVLVFNIEEQQTHEGHFDLGHPYDMNTTEMLQVILDFGSLLAGIYNVLPCHAPHMKNNINRIQSTIFIDSIKNQIS